MALCVDSRSLLIAGIDLEDAGPTISPTLVSHAILPCAQ